jgi:ATP-binding cassette, subfamily B, bacterial MsbA
MSEVTRRAHARAPTLLSLLSLLRLHRWGFPAIVVLGLLQSLSEGIGIGLFLPLLDVLVVRSQPRAGGQWLAGAMDGVFRNVAPEHRLAIIVLCLFAAVLTSALLAYLHGVLFAWLDGNIGHHLRREIFAQLLHVNFGFIERDRSGRLLNVLGTDTWRTSDALKMLVRVMITASTIAVYVVLLLLMSWRLTLLVAGALLLISSAVRMFTKGVREFGAKATESNAELGHLMMEGVDGMRVIRAFGREDYEHERFEQCSNRVRRAFLRVHFLEEAVHPIHDFLAAALLLLIVFATARSGGDVSGLLVFSFVLYRLQPRVKDFDASRLRLAALLPSVEEVRSLIDPAGKQYVTSGTAVHQGLDRGIVFDRVSFSYDKADDPALTDASFTIAAGKTTALVGLSGGGKSTIIKLILRFEDPTDGAILLDGRPLPEFDLASWRSQLALVSQDVYLFNATVRENIAYGRLEAGQDEIVEAARKADAHDFIERLPAKYDTVLGPRGVRLSGGQQQRISLARAIIRNPRVLILDEATNALDSISEQWIQDTLDKLREHRTVIMIAHRLSTIERADQIIVLDTGRVVERGTLAELIKADGLFARLYELQHRLSAAHDA